MNKKIGYLAIFLIGYVVFLNYNLVSDLGFDEARHSIQGIFFYDYFSTVLSGDWQSPKDFLRAYVQQHYSIDWYAMYDPPVHAISQAIVFSVLDVSSFTARFATMLWVLFGSVLLYLLSKAVFKEEKWSLICVALFLLTPFTYYFARQAMLTIPIALLITGWYYFTFYSKYKYNWLWSTFCLSGAGLMKYQTMIFFAVFAVAYAIILFIKSKGDLFKRLNETCAIVQVRYMVVQSIGFLVFFFPWYWFSLRSSNVASKLFGAGIIEVKGGTIGTLGYFFSFFTQSVSKTWGLILLALIPIIVWVICERGKHHKVTPFLEAHWPMFLFIVTTFITATLLISNKQFRYMVHVLPFLIIFSTQGLKVIVDILKRRKLQRVIPIIFVILFSTLVYADIYESNRTASEWGVAQYDLYDWLAQQHIPRIVLDVSVHHTQTTHNSNFYHNPDLVLFKAMSLSTESNPQFMKQAVARVDLNKPSKITHILDFLSITNETHSQFLILHKRPALSIQGEIAGNQLMNHGFSKKEFKEYFVYYKINPQHSTTQQIFPSLAQKASSIKRFLDARDLMDQQNYVAARQALVTSYRRDPLNPPLLEEGNELSKQIDLKIK